MAQKLEDLLKWLTQAAQESGDYIAPADVKQAYNTQQQLAKQQSQQDIRTEVEDSAREKVSYGSVFERVGDWFMSDSKQDAIRAENERKDAEEALRKQAELNAWKKVELKKLNDRRATGQINQNQFNTAAGAIVNSGEILPTAAEQTPTAILKGFAKTGGNMIADMAEQTGDSARRIARKTKNTVIPDFGHVSTESGGSDKIITGQKIANDKYPELEQFIKGAGSFGSSEAYKMLADGKGVDEVKTFLKGQQQAKSYADKQTIGDVLTMASFLPAGKGIKASTELLSSLKAKDMAALLNVGRKTVAPEALAGGMGNLGMTLAENPNASAEELFKQTALGTGVGAAFGGVIPVVGTPLARGARAVNQRIDRGIEKFDSKLDGRIDPDDGASLAEIEADLDKWEAVREKERSANYQSSHQIDSKTSRSLGEVGDVDSDINAIQTKYGLTSRDQKDIASLKTLIKNPETETKIYRASPKNELNDGDWVTTDKDYADSIKDQNGGKVYEYSVKAKELNLPKNIEDNPSLARFSAFQYKKAVDDVNGSSASRVTTTSGQTADDLVHLANQQKSSFIDDAKAVAKLNDGSISNKTIKNAVKVGVGRIEEKIKSKKGRTPTDILRTTITTVDPSGKMDAIIKEFKNKGYEVWEDNGVPDITNRYTDGSLGYKDVAIKLSKGSDDPIVKELLLVSPNMYKAKTEWGGHKLYKQVRAKIGDFVQAEKTMNELYEAADSLDTAVLKASSEISRPSRALPSPNGVPSKVYPATSSPSSTSLTGTPSTIKNRGNLLDKSVISDPPSTNIIAKKPTKVNSTDSLKQEALKYKTAEEFVQSELDKIRKEGYNASHETRSQPSGHTTTAQGQEVQRIDGRGKGQTAKNDTSNASALTKFINENPDGFTLKLNGEPVTSGFAVSPYKGREAILDKIDEASLDKFLTENSDLLLLEDNYLGGWLNKADGKFYLDISVVKNSRDEALRIAHQNDQIAIFDLSKLQELNTIDELTADLTKAYNQAHAEAKKPKRFNSVKEALEDPEFYARIQKANKSLNSSRVTKTSNNLYHTTKAENLDSIRAGGLQIGRPSRYEGVSSPTKISLSANEKTAKYYGGSNDVMLRTKTSYRPKDLDHDLLAGGDGTYTTGQNIPPEALEIKVGKKWKPLLQTGNQAQAKTKIKLKEGKRYKQLRDRRIKNSVQRIINRKHADIDEFVDDYAKMKVQMDEVETRNIYKEIRQQGGISESAYEDIPPYVKNKNGVPADKMAQVLGFPDEDALVEAIHLHQPGKVRKSKAVYTQEAREELASGRGGEASEEYKRLQKEAEKAKQGKLGTPRLALGIEAKAIQHKLTKEFKDLPEYEKISIKDQGQKVSELIKNDFDKAKRIAMGDEVPPGDVLPESVLIGVEEYAIATKDMALIAELGTHSKLTSEATKMGQRIRMLRERDPYSAVRVVSRLAKERRALVEKKLGKNIDKEIENTTKAIKKVQTVPTKTDWSTFVESIKC